jgi:predicted dehydrogenase
VSERRRVAVVGLGVGLSHLASFAELPEEFELIAVCDPDAERLESAGEHFGVPARYADLDELLANETLDVVDLATPPDLHFDQCMRVLESGRHVICEKPLVPSLRQLDELERAEARSGRRVMPIFQYRFGRGIQRLRHLVDAGVTGRAYLSTVETAWRRGKAYYSVPWRGRWDTERGGVLLSHAIHAHDLLCFVVGDIRRVFARATTRVNPIETEDCAAVSLEMADGSLATLSATLGSKHEISRMRFCFEHLTAESCLEPYAPGSEPWSFTPAHPEVEKRMDEALEGFEPGAELYTGQFAGLAGALRDGGDPPVTLADARRSVELVSALYHSAETGLEVELPLDESHPMYDGWIREGRGPALRTGA